MTETGFFEFRSSARRYAKYRPLIHSRPISQFKALSGIRKPLSRVLDVGCGTGHSSKAATVVGRSVIGTDRSREMLSEAERAPGVEYVQARAEELPYVDESFDLVTAGLAIHWFSPDRFFPACRTVLKRHGWLVIYTSWFAGKMKENQDFLPWLQNSYLKRYPTPPRPKADAVAAMASSYAFELVGEKEYADQVLMSHEQLVGFFLSQSNVIAAVEKGSESIESATEWLGHASGEFFVEAKPGTFVFQGRSWFYRKTDPSGSFPRD